MRPWCTNAGVSVVLFKVRPGLDCGRLSFTCKLEDGGTHPTQGPQAQQRSNENVLPLSPLTGMRLWREVAAGFLSAALSCLGPSTDLMGLLLCVRGGDRARVYGDD